MRIVVVSSDQSAPLSYDCRCLVLMITQTQDARGKTGQQLLEFLWGSANGNTSVEETFGNVPVQSADFTAAPVVIIRRSIPDTGKAWRNRIKVENRRKTLTREARAPLRESTAR